MTVQCIDCTCADPKGAGAMARQGYARCAHLTSAEFMSLVYPRECDQFKNAPAGVATARATWLKTQRKAA